MKSLIGLVLAFAIGAFCRYAGIPSPAPPVVEGALLVLAMTLGFVIARIPPNIFVVSLRASPATVYPDLLNNLMNARALAQMMA